MQLAGATIRCICEGGWLPNGGKADISADFQLFDECIILFANRSRLTTVKSSEFNQLRSNPNCKICAQNHKVLCTWICSRRRVSDCIETTIASAISNEP